MKTAYIIAGLSALGMATPTPVAKRQDTFGWGVQATAGEAATESKRQDTFGWGVQATAGEAAEKAKRQDTFGWGVKATAGDSAE